MLEASENHRLAGLYDQLRLKLLDLTRRNRMLNYSLGGRSRRHVQFVDEVIDAVHLTLVQNEASLQILPLEEPDDIPQEEKSEDFLAALEHARNSNIEYLTGLEALESQGRDDEHHLARLERKLRDAVRDQLGLPPRPQRGEINRAAHARSRGIDPNVELQPRASRPSHSDDALQTLLFPDDLERLMGKISADARLAEQEMGVSTLFLALGFLEWYESETSDTPAFAPLLLLPVDLRAQKVRGHETFSISAREGAAESNLSLRKLLQTNFNRALPEFEWHENDSSEALEEYFSRVRTAVEGLSRWRIHRWMVLGHFAFGRFAMYVDLDPQNWPTQPADNPLLASILRGSERLGDDGDALLSIPEDYDIDDPEVESCAPALIHDADASQHSALVDVMKGQNLVIQGPPGTGKSQTITNIIANALCAEKTVLFLAEKQAALEVVKRRLVQAGLGDFCLEVHSDKAAPKSVVESLKRRVRTVRDRAEPTGADPVWKSAREELTQYTLAMNSEDQGSATLFDQIWKAVRGRAEHADVFAAFKTVALPKERLADAHERAVLEGKLEVFADACLSFASAHGHPANSPWTKVELGEVDLYSLESLIEAIEAFRRVKADMIGLSTDANLSFENVQDLEAFVKLDKGLGDPAGLEMLARVADLDLDEFSRLLSIASELHRLDQTLLGRQDLASESSATLDIASSLLGTSLPPELTRLTPAQLYAMATNVIERNRTIIELCDGLLPICELLGISTSSPAATLETASVAVRALSAMPAAQRDCVSVRVDIDPIRFRELFKRWSSLADEEAKWRQRLPRYAEPWPEPNELEKASVTLRKTGLSSVIAAVSGAGKEARELASRLGLDPSTASGDAVAELSAHARAVRQFEQDKDAEKLLGPDWRGLASPFRDIATGLKIRELFTAHIGGLPNGRDVVNGLIWLSSGELASLASPKHGAAAIALSEASEELRSHLDNRSIAELRTVCLEENRRMRAVLDRDPQRLLSHINLPLNEIHEISGLLAKRRAAINQIDASNLGNTVRTLASSEVDVRVAQAAAEWARSVHSSECPGDLRVKLLGPNAAAERALLRGLAVRASELASRHGDALRRLTDNIQVGGLETLPATQAVTYLADLLAHVDELPDFLAIQRYRRELIDSGLGPFLARADEVELSPSQLVLLLGVLQAEQAAAKRCAIRPLSQHTGSTLDAVRRRFVERDRHKLKADRARVRAQLLEKRPLPGSDYGPKRDWTEMKLLRNEFDKQQRFLAVRKLLAQAGQSIQRLKPCFMMSPLSLAKFVGPGSLLFDLLIIDEASQMKPEDALGGVLRAKQIVVVGDQRQLPPTDFFNRASSADEEFQDIDDESILEACQKSFRQVRRLKWHYRSRCESLIRFSNENFYGDSPLITFPVARPSAFSIDIVRVDGAYQKGRNVSEASRIAQEAVQFMRRYADWNDDRIPTLGLVALNMEQRELIREELALLSANEPAVEHYQEKVAERGEPLFVKNLENVQGDERDFIFISMTYGKESGATRMAQRFGPINGKHGHRRLNVLFTRARARIALFTSFGSLDVVAPEAGQYDGPRVLKAYLEYAERRGRRAADFVGGEPDSDFEVAVAERLRSRNYQVDLQVGSSGYRIDLGVRHPDHPERYLAGIECDGARYHSSRSARDRDRLREEILNGLGWRIIRVWSTDWFRDPNSATEKLADRLEELRRTAEGDEDHLALVEWTAAEPPPAPGIEPELEPPVPATLAQDPVLSTVPATSITPTVSDPLAVASVPEAGPLTPDQAKAALADFRDRVIRAEMPDAEPQRSVLREAMIETFISQALSDPGDWFRKVPAYLRQGTDPAEKNRYLERICDIVARIEARTLVAAPARGEDFRLQPPSVSTKPAQPTLPLGFQSKPVSSEGSYYTTAEAALADMSVNPDRFYDNSYRTVLRQMIGLVVATEGPIFEDVLVDRIARAHGFQRSGATIYNIVAAAIGREYPRSREETRIVIWPQGASTSAPIAFRASASGSRTHNDIPLAELAGLAASFLRRSASDEEIIRRMADRLGVGRLRESTRERLEKALQLARQPNG